MKNAPDEIYLDLGTDEADDFADLAGVTWSRDNATGHGIRYRRARTPTALIPQLRRQVKATVMSLIAECPEGEIADTLDAGLDAALSRLLPAPPLADDVRAAVERMLPLMDAHTSLVRAAESLPDNPLAQECSSTMADLRTILTHLEQRDG